MKILFATPVSPDARLLAALADAGHTVSHTSDCLQAVELTRKERHDAVVADLFFEQLSAIEMIGRIRSLSPDTIVITTDSAPAPRQSSPPGLESLGIKAHLTHPLDPAHLHELITCESHALSAR